MDHMQAEENARFDELLRRISENDPETTAISSNCKGLSVSDQQAARLADALRGNTYVNHIDIGLDTSICSPQGLRRITQFIAKEGSKVRKLGIHGYVTQDGEDDPDAQTTMFQMFFDAACDNGKIQGLLVDRNSDTASLVACLQKLRSTLKSFALDAGPEDIQELAVTIPTLPLLETLQIEDSPEQTMTSIATLLTRLVGDDRQELKKLKELTVYLEFYSEPGKFSSNENQVGVLCNAICEVLQSATNLEWFAFGVPSANPGNPEMENHLTHVWNAIKEHESLRELDITFGTLEFILTFLTSYTGTGKSLESLSVTLPFRLSGAVKWQRRIGEVLSPGIQTSKKQLNLKELRVIAGVGQLDFDDHEVKNLPLEFIDGFRKNTSLTDVYIDWIHMDFYYESLFHDDDSSSDGSNHQENDRESVNDGDQELVNDGGNLSSEGSTHQENDQELLIDGDQERAEVIGCVSLPEGKRAIEFFCLRNKFLQGQEAAKLLPDFLTHLVEMQSNASQDQQYKEDDVLSGIYEALRLCEKWKEQVGSQRSE